MNKTRIICSKCKHVFDSEADYRGHSCIGER